MVTLRLCLRPRLLVARSTLLRARPRDIPNVFSESASSRRRPKRLSSPGLELSQRGDRERRGGLFLCIRSGRADVGSGGAGRLAAIRSRGIRRPDSCHGSGLSASQWPPAEPSWMTAPCLRGRRCGCGSSGALRRFRRGYGGVARAHGKMTLAVANCFCGADCHGFDCA
jgi:hypothetical protein